MQPRGTVCNERGSQKYTGLDLLGQSDRQLNAGSDSPRSLWVSLLDEKAPGRKESAASMLSFTMNLTGL